MRIPNPMKVLVLVFDKLMLNTVHIASDAPPITYVYVATVDGRSLPKKGSPLLSVLVFAQNGQRRLHYNVCSFLFFCYPFLH